METLGNSPNGLRACYGTDSTWRQRLDNCSLIQLYRFSRIEEVENKDVVNEEEYVCITKSWRSCTLYQLHTTIWVLAMKKRNKYHESQKEWTSRLRRKSPQTPQTKMSPHLPPPCKSVLEINFFLLDAQGQSKRKFWKGIKVDNEAFYTTSRCVAFFW